MWWCHCCDSMSIMPGIMQTGSEKGSYYSFHPTVCAGTGVSYKHRKHHHPSRHSHLHTTLVQTMLCPRSVEREVPCQQRGDLSPSPPEGIAAAPIAGRAIAPQSCAEGVHSCCKMSMQSRTIKMGISFWGFLTLSSLWESLWLMSV